MNYESDLYLLAVEGVLLRETEYKDQNLIYFFGRKVLLGKVSYFFTHLVETSTVIILWNKKYFGD